MLVTYPLVIYFDHRSLLPFAASLAALLGRTFMPVAPDFRIFRRLINGLVPLFLFALGSVLIVGCTKQEQTSKSVRPALAYKITPGGGSDLDIYSGDIRARHEVNHAFRVGGKIARRLVDAGTTVKRGQPLAELDPQDVRLAADAAEAQVAALKTESDFTNAELQRFRELFTKGFISQSALDQKVNIANTARAKLDAQKASANVSINQAGYATLLAQIDGVVTQVSAEAGQVVTAGQPILHVANPNELELAIAVPESRITDFRGHSLKRPIRVHLWSSPETFYAGTVREVAGAADVVARTYAARISLNVSPAQRAQIGLGMSAFAAFVGTDALGTFTVPLSSLYAQGDNIGVWKIAADGKVSLQPVKVVQYRETNALVSSKAIKSGDIIVAAGVQKLRDGEVVRPIVDPAVKGDGKVAQAPSLPEASQLAARIAANTLPATR